MQRFSIATDFVVHKLNKLILHNLFDLITLSKKILFYLKINMILLIFILISFFIYYIWQRRNLLRLAQKLKGPIGYPIIGSAYKFLNANSE